MFCAFRRPKELLVDSTRTRSGLSSYATSCYRVHRYRKIQKVLIEYLRSFIKLFWIFPFCVQYVVKEMMKKLSSNQELYEYLLFLSSVLKQRGSKQLDEIVGFAIGFASTFPPAEFIYESRLALERILEQENGVLTDQERKDARRVFKQLNKACKKRFL